MPVLYLYFVFLLFLEIGVKIAMQNDNFIEIRRAEWYEPIKWYYLMDGFDVIYYEPNLDCLGIKRASDKKVRSPDIIKRKRIKVKPSNAITKSVWASGVWCELVVNLSVFCPQFSSRRPRVFFF